MHLWNVHKTANGFKPSHLQKRTSKKVAQTDKIETTIKEVRAIPWAKNEAREKKATEKIYIKNKSTHFRHAIKMLLFTMSQPRTTIYN